MRRILAVRDARVFLVGWTLSQFGDWAMIIVLAIWAKSLTGSNADAGLVFFALTVPSLFSPLSGMLVDRVRRRPLLIATYSIEAVGVLAVLFVHNRSDVWILYAVAVFYGAMSTISSSARSALLTTTLPRELLAEANGIFQSVREGLRLIAPLVGAGIYAVAGGGVVAVIDSASFVAVVVALALMRAPEPRFERVERRVLSEAVAGARHIFRTLPLRQMVLATGACLLVAGFSETLIFAVIARGLHRAPSYNAIPIPTTRTSPMRRKMRGAVNPPAIAPAPCSELALRGRNRRPDVRHLEPCARRRGHHRRRGRHLVADRRPDHCSSGANTAPTPRTCFLGRRPVDQHAANDVDRARRSAHRARGLPHTRRRRGSCRRGVRRLAAQPPDGVDSCDSG